MPEANYKMADSLLGARSQMKNRSSIISFAATFSLALVSAVETAAQTPIPVTVRSQVPNELNPTGGGAPTATPEQAVAFAWQEFIALNWPAGPQQGKPNQRDAASLMNPFGDPTYTGPTVWETFRSKVEIFPGNADVMPPPGYPGPKGDMSFGYDAPPTYNYAVGVDVSPAVPPRAGGSTPWVNLDETDQITLDNMYAGVVHWQLAGEQRTEADPLSGQGQSISLCLRGRQ